MTTSIGNADRVIGLIVVIVIILLSVFRIITSTMDLILPPGAGLLALTAMGSIYPLYHLLGINTYRKKHPANDKK